ncbi:hypothetical protein GCM10023149_44370 [Mucilaginibacter gynuensis]|uniref:Uncharacterized protein n=1 Tax=Mucilaginibacter gynuensis TaxID=1302236 RepID=A0ABP8H8X3_9SPHI
MKHKLLTACLCATLALAACGGAPDSNAGDTSVATDSPKIDTPTTSTTNTPAATDTPVKVNPADTTVSDTAKPGPVH